MLHWKHYGTSFWLVKRVWRALDNKLVKQRKIQITISPLDHLQSTNGKDKDCNFDYSVYLPLNSVKTRRVRRKLVYLWLHTFQGVNSFCRAVFLFFLVCRTEPCLSMHFRWGPIEMRLTNWSQRYEACSQDRYSYRPLSCGGHFVPGD